MKPEHNRNRGGVELIIPVLSRNRLDNRRVNGGMLNRAQHRAFVLTLTCALLLSSTGLPVIVMVCAMGKTVMATGCAGSCHTADISGERIARIPCTAECGFVERNTTAYLPAKHPGKLSPLQVLTVVPYLATATPTFASLTSPPTGSPPAAQDIPILTSSLLI